ncbi:hypothetical protein SISNIDRAFT_465157 [Sistotremastrum niveocremeum HHB9708]|uniref:Uncharacterized protein n=1 Tax=Sistotremastrum niveocremeum HHB9708 TaxID=1314777 RepID=A0A164WBQ1_9AGAM|nr:hypothetical protein SISNIDRAFT_465157 [Sistotremastrum niveocremeum HHB9708]
MGSRDLQCSSESVDPADGVGIVVSIVRASSRRHETRLRDRDCIERRGCNRKSGCRIADNGVRGVDDSKVKARSDNVTTCDKILSVLARIIWLHNLGESLLDRLLYTTGEKGGPVLPEEGERIARRLDSKVSMTYMECSLEKTDQVEAVLYEAFRQALTEHSHWEKTKRAIRHKIERLSL